MNAPNGIRLRWFPHMHTHTHTLPMLIPFVKILNVRTIEYMLISQSDDMLSSHAKIPFTFEHKRRTTTKQTTFWNANQPIELKIGDSYLNSHSISHLFFNSSGIHSPACIHLSQALHFKTEKKNCFCVRLPKNHWKIGKFSINYSVGLIIYLCYLLFVLPCLWPIFIQFQWSKCVPFWYFHHEPVHSPQSLFNGLASPHAFFIPHLRTPYYIYFEISIGHW